jgi:predicted aspartyl protease
LKRLALDNVFLCGKGQEKDTVFESKTLLNQRIIMRQTLIKYIGFLVLGSLTAAAEKSNDSQLGDDLLRLGYSVAVGRKDRANKLVLEGVLGEKKRLFLVDTGWGITALDNTAARGLKTASDLGAVLEDPVLGQITESVVMEKLTLGGSTFLNQPAAVQKLEMDYLTTEENGVLGCDFLLRNFCLIDCGFGRLFFRSAARSVEQTKAMEESLRREGFIEVSMNRGYGFTVDSKIKNLGVRWVVDTGAAYSVLDETQIRRLSLMLEKVRAPETGTLVTHDISGRAAGVGKIGAHKFRVTTPNALQIGAREWKNVRFEVMNLENWGIGVPGKAWETVQGMLGEDMLISSGALIDCAGGKLWFRPAKATPR